MNEKMCIFAFIRFNVDGGFPSAMQALNETT